MHVIKKMLGLDNPEADIFLRVQPITHGGFGVYANRVLISIHNDQASADAHCQRLRDQQAADQ